MPRKIVYGVLLIAAGLVEITFLVANALHITTSVTNSRFSAVETRAREDGWNVVQIGLDMNQDFVVLRARISKEGGRFYHRVEQCMYSRATLKLRAPCRGLTMVETVPPQ